MFKKTSGPINSQPRSALAHLGLINLRSRQDGSGADRQISLPEEWSAGLVVRLLGLSGTCHLCIDRTNWKIGARDVNILMLAITTQRFRVPLMLTLLDRAGSSNTGERIELMRRCLALFSAGSVRLLLADREFNGLEWLNFLKAHGVPFAIRVKAGMIVITEDGRRLRLRSLLAKRRPGWKFQATFPAQGDAAALTLTFAAKRIRGSELLIVASMYRIRIP